MRFIRTFSTAIIRRRQALYEPYFPPLNKKQQKALRKEVMKDIPHYHLGIKRDLCRLYGKYGISERHLEVRHTAFRRLKSLVQELSNGKTGGDYDLVDVSIGIADGTHTRFDAPLECFIIDKARPKGLPDSYGNEPLPIAYDALALSQMLRSHNYNGTFIDTAPDTTYYSFGKQLDGPRAFIQEHNWPDDASSSTYRPFNVIYPVLPPTLRIIAKDDLEPEIHLHPAHPTHSLRCNLINCYFQKIPDLPELSSFLWHWAQSWNIRHFTPLTCIFLTLSFFQQKLKLSPMARSTSEGFWSSVTSNLETYYLRMEELKTSKIPTTPPGRTGPMLYQLIKFFSMERGFYHKHIIDIRGATNVPRSKKFFESTQAVFWFEGEERIKNDVERRLKNREPLSSEPEIWKYHPLVVRDPFLPHHNVAHMVTKDALFAFASTAAKTSTTIKRGHPISDAFGPYTIPLRHITGGEAGRDHNPFHKSERTFSVSSNAGSSHGSFFHAPPVPLPVIEARSRTIARVQEIIRDNYGRMYSVECFGSTQYGVDTSSSDLDLVIIDPDRSNGFSPDVDLRKLPPIYHVRDLARILRRNGMTITAAIPKAVVPIVKFEDKTNRVSCDININDQLGAFNTRLIAKYCELQPLLRPLLSAIKKWAKSHGLNSPSGEHGPPSFSSYALALMTIGFLQSYEMLPNLQAGLPHLGVETGGFWMRAKTGERVRCDPRFNTSPQWTPPENANTDIRNALHAWFDYWAYQHRYDHELLSIRDGGILPRAPRPPSKKGGGKGKTKKVGQGGVIDAATPALNALAVSAEVGDIAEPSHDVEIEVLNKSADTVKASALEAEDETIPRPEALDEDALEESGDVDLRMGREPLRWSNSDLVVADPFILAKNVTGAISQRVVTRFRAECIRSSWLLSQECTFDELVGEGGPQADSDDQHIRSAGGEQKGKNKAMTGQRSKTAQGSSDRGKENRRRWQGRVGRDEENEGEREVELLANRDAGRGRVRMDGVEQGATGVIRGSFLNRRGQRGGYRGGRNRGRGQEGGAKPVRVPDELSQAT